MESKDDQAGNGVGLNALTRDSLSAVLKRMSNVCIGRAACVSKLWSEAAAGALEDPQQRFTCEFGPGCGAAVEEFCRQMGVEVPWKALMGHCQTSLPELSHEQHVARCHHFLCGVIKSWVLSVSATAKGEEETHHQAEGRLMRDFSPVLVLPLPQSMWLRFTLPVDVIPDDPDQPMPLQLRGVCASSQPVLLDLPTWHMPANDTERFWDSHTTGVYAWRGRSGEGSFQLAPHDGESADECQVLHMAVYIHFEQLLGPEPHTMRSYDVPQRLPLAACGESLTQSPISEPDGPFMMTDAAAERGVPPRSGYLEVVADFCKLRTEGRLGGFRAKLAPCLGDGADESENLHWSLIPDQLKVFEVPEQSHSINPSIIRFLQTILRPEVKGANESEELPGSADIQSEASLDVLEELCSTEALLDFALYDHEGRLLIGRSGVEMWESELDEEGARGRADGPDDEHQPLHCWRVNFLVDGLDNSMWENRVELKPGAREPAATVELSLTPEAWHKINLSARLG